MNYQNFYLPARIGRLGELAYNVWWSWNPDASALFQYLDKTLWEMTQNNPVKLLRQIAPTKLESAAADPAFKSLMLEFPTEAEIAALIGKEVNADHVREARRRIRAAIATSSSNEAVRSGSRSAGAPSSAA